MESIETEVCVESGKSDRQGRRIRGAAEWSSILDRYDQSGLTQGVKRGHVVIFAITSNQSVMNIKRGQMHIRAQRHHFYKKQ